jgi:hypothetical protein
MKIEDGDQLTAVAKYYKLRQGALVNVYSLALLVKRKTINKILQTTYNVLCYNTFD